MNLTNFINYLDWYAILFLSVYVFLLIRLIFFTVSKLDNKKEKLLKTLVFIGITFLLNVSISTYLSKDLSNYRGGPNPSGEWCDFGYDDRVNECCDDDSYYCEEKDYRNNPPLKKFISIDTSRSSFITGAWYRKSMQQLLLQLNGKNYWYCNVPISTWNDFKKSVSLGSYYNIHIKGRFICEKLDEID